MGTGADRGWLTVGLGVCGRWIRGQDMEEGWLIICKREDASVGLIGFVQPL